MLILKSPKHVRDLAFSHCGRWLAAGHFATGGARVWDMTNPTAKPFGPVEEHYTSGLAFRRDGSLFYCTPAGRSYLFDLATRECRKLGGTRPNRFVVSPDGERIVRTSARVPLRIWTIRGAGTPVPATVKCPGYSIFGAAFTPDGTAFAVYENHIRRDTQSQFVVRETATNKIVGAVPIGPLGAAEFVLTSGGAHIVAPAAAELNCWSFAEPKQPPRTVPNPNRKYFTALTAHPHGPVITADTSGTVRLWSVPDLTPYRTFEWKTGKLWALAVSHDGTRVAAGGDQAKVTVWDWD